jgi:hypothetical protein
MRIQAGAGEPVQNLVPNGFEIIDRCIARRQGQAPARIVCDLCRVVQGIGIRTHRRPACSVTQNPVLQYVVNATVMAADFGAGGPTGTVRQPRAMSHLNVEGEHALA